MIVSVDNKMFSAVVSKCRNLRQGKHLSMCALKRTTNDTALLLHCSIEYIIESVCGAWVVFMIS